MTTAPRRVLVVAGGRCRAARSSGDGLGRRWCAGARALAASRGSGAADRARLTRRRRLGRGDGARDEGLDPRDCVGGRVWCVAATTRVSLAVSARRVGSRLGVWRRRREFVIGGGRRRIPGGRHGERYSRGKAGERPRRKSGRRRTPGSSRAPRADRGQARREARRWRRAAITAGLSTPQRRSAARRAALAVGRNIGGGGVAAGRLEVCVARWMELLVAASRGSQRGIGARWRRAWRRALAVDG